MLDSVTTAAGTVSTVNAGTGNISIEDIQKYGKYIEVLRNLGQLKENEKPLVDLKNKTLVADRRIFQWLYGFAALQRHYTGGFDVRIVEDAFTFLRKCHKKACQGKIEYRIWAEEISREFNKVGIDKDFDHRKLKKAKDVKEIDELFAKAAPENQGIKRVLKYYFTTENGPKIQQCIVRIGRQFSKMQLPPAAPAAPPLPTHALTNSRVVRERPGTMIRAMEGTSPKETTGSRIFAGSFRLCDPDQIKNGRDSLRRNSVYVPALPKATEEKKSLNEAENRNLGTSESDSKIKKDDEIEQRLESLAVVQFVQDQCARSLMQSRMLTIAKDTRDPSIENLVDWEFEGRNTQELPPPIQQIPLPENHINRNKNYIVTRVGNSSVILDEKAMRKGLKKALKHKFRVLRSTNDAD